ncbi:MAG: hypothetical protein M1814_001688 [Vezdaea aestivalis]|nr:MAG: hypothetical protein M1814_001688 [Vezdaea aestivalis]
MTPLEPPPPYSPDDPNSRPLTPAHAAQAASVPTLALTPTDGDPRASPAIFTPPASPNQHSHQLSDVAAEEPAFSASLAYFESRPTIMQLPPEVLFHDLIITEDSGPDNLPYPQPELVWKARDVTDQDWLTFKNFLFPLAQMAANAQIVERKMQAELDRREQEQPNAEINALYPPQLGAVPGSRDTDEKSKWTPVEPEAERAERVGIVLAEWNEGFFQPRGLKLTATMIPYNQPPPSPAPSSITMVSNIDGESGSYRTAPDEPSAPSLPAAAESSSTSAAPPVRRQSSDSATLHSPTVEEDPVGALRKTLAKFLLSSRQDPETALTELGAELRSQKTISLREVKKELHAAKSDMYRDWKSAMEEHKQNSKVYKNLKKAEWEQRKIEWDRKKEDRKGKERADTCVRKSDECAEKKQRKEEKRKLKHERRTLKKELKAEHKRQIKALYGCKSERRASFSPLPQDSAATQT